MFRWLLKVFLYSIIISWSFIIQAWHANIQTFDDGSTLQTFDDGSTIAVWTDGSVTSSPATDWVPVRNQNMSSPSTPSNSKLTSPWFTFDTSTINPSSNPNKFSRTGSSTQNVKNLLKTIAETLLVVVATGAVLFIVIGGFFMVTSAGDTEKANRGKIIITYNLIALALAMLSYGIMRLVVWIIW
jgi:Type IV secretion system pilin